ncbi:MAG TPA: DUF4268 domain-containing protein [Chryseolinea sp.]|nr:DUF4268 domain-containing protein [Chryseolinea sp.]HPM31210.1 DUF4268 domain-containing protein [Chryseolinea sp.]
MFLIDKQENSIRSISKKTFSELGFKERAHLQEWIASNAEALGEKLLIIQKEFSGFNETYERLDLLAIDKSGNLVIIENKLDDSGRDVTWQALKYASYCSTLKKDEIKSIYQSYLNTAEPSANAEEKIIEFLEEDNFIDVVLNQNMNQRIILISANFRKEVTSTVMWLMKFKLQLQCFKATPYELDGQYLLTLDQIIPTVDAQDYIISMNNKSQEEFSQEVEIKNRHKLRLKFWGEFLNAVKGKSTVFQSSNPTKDNILYAGGTDITYLSFTVIITESYVGVALNLSRSEKEENKILFDALRKHAEAIEALFGNPLLWERKDDQKKSAIGYYKQGVSYFNSDDWPGMISFLIEQTNNLEKSVRPYLPEVKAALVKAK